jgi:hypothetical protein
MLPFLVTEYLRNADGGGPDTTFPLVSKTPPWQGHSKFVLDLLYDTEQPWWVHFYVSATYVSFAVQITITPFFDTKPPTVFRVAFDDAERSRSKFTSGAVAAVGSSFLQLSKNDANAVAPSKPHDVFINPFLSICVNTLIVLIDFG